MNPPSKQGWLRKFRVAGAGLVSGVRGQTSFLVHVPATLLILGVIVLLRLPVASSAILLLCIGLVWTAELFNTSIEILVRKLHPEHDVEIGRALDVSAAAVLVASITAAICGATVLIHAVWQFVVPGAS